jgi:hypothetical protein
MVIVRVKFSRQSPALECSYKLGKRKMQNRCPVSDLHFPGTGKDFARIGLNKFNFQQSVES